MKQPLGLTLLSLVLLAMIPALGQDEPLATVNGEPIMESDLTVGPEWRRLEQQSYRVRLQALNAEIAERLLNAEAQRREMSVQDLIAAEIGPKVGAPTNSEIKAFYDQRRDQIGQPLKEVRDQIERQLTQQKAAIHLQDYVVLLRSDADIEINLDYPRLPVELTDVRQRGPEGAPVTIVEFSDFQCPFCRQVQPVLAELREEFEDRILWVFKDLPQSEIHPEAVRAAQAARCAGDQGKFWEYKAKLFEQELFTDATYTEVAEATRVKPNPLLECMDSGKHETQVAAEVLEARNLGIDGTPAILINGILLSGAQGIENYRRVIEQELKDSVDN